MKNNFQDLSFLKKNSNLEFLNKRTLFSILLLMTMSSQAAQEDYFCWNNEDGVRECGNHVPSAYSQKGFWKLDAGGTWIYVKPAKTKEEMAELERQQEEEEKRKEQDKKDRKLLDAFENEEEIEDARQAELNTIDGQIESIKTILEGLQGNLKTLEESFKFNKENELLDEHQTKAVTTDIESLKKRINDAEETLQSKRLERKTVEEKYDTFKQKYQEIKRRNEERQKDIEQEKQEN